MDSLIEDANKNQEPLLKLGAPLRVDSTLSIIDFLIQPGYLELIVEGADFPTQYYLRLGQKTFFLRRRNVFPEQEEGGRALYSVRLHEPLPAGEFDLTKDGTWTETNYDLRRGDRKGRQPPGLPQVFRPGERPPVLASGATLTSLSITGWAFNTRDPAAKVMLTLVERIEREPDVFEEKTLSASAADQPSPEGVERHGEAGTGFSIAVPGSLIDGKPHAIHLYAHVDTHTVPIWEGVFQSDQATVKQWMAECDRSSMLRSRLSLLAEAGMLDVIAGYFKAPLNYSHLALTQGEAFSVLACALLHAHLLLDEEPDQERQEHIASIEAAYLSLSGNLVSDAENIGALIDLGDQFFKGDRGPLALGRFPHSPLAEAYIDLAMIADTLPLKGDRLSKLAQICNASNRFAMTYELARRRGKLPADEELQMQLKIATADINLGRFAEAEKAIRAFLTKKKNHRQALNMMARLYSLRGDPLRAAATIQSGKGITAWVNNPPQYHLAKHFAALDWFGINALVAQVKGNQGLATNAEHEREVFGEPVDPDSEGFSVVFTDKAQRDFSALFFSLRQIGCMQVLNQRDVPMDQVEFSGRWVLIFLDARTAYVQPEVVSAYFQQLRRHESVLELVTANMDGIGLPKDFGTAALLVRQDVMRLFGGCTPADFLKQAHARLATKRLLL